MKKEVKEIKRIASRKDLIALFERGRLPTAEHFEKLINSNFNKADDRLDIDEENGLMVYPASKGKLLNFFKGSDDEEAKYIVSISNDGISFQEARIANKLEEDIDDKPEFFIQEGSGNIGIGNNSPSEKLDIQGMVASQGRVGNYKEGMIPTDGSWYNVFDNNLSSIHAFEVMAYARGGKGKGKYSLLHAIATCTYGKSNISKTVSQFGRSKDKINIRWVSKASTIREGDIKGKTDKKKKEGSLFLKIFQRTISFFKFLVEPRLREYNLQLRTMSHYGINKSKDDPNDIMLFYKIAVLWKPNLIPRESEKNHFNDLNREA